MNSKVFNDFRQAGFTMVELIVTMMIIGILAVVAIPRFSEQSAFETRTFNDDVLAALRYAQKAAIASRRNVCVSFATSSVSLTTASTSGAGAACDVDLAGPTGTAPFTVTAKSGTSFSSLPISFHFDSLGRSSSATQTFQVTGVPTTITIERETGYVHP